MINAYLEALTLNKERALLNAEDICFLNILQKIAREIHSPTEDGIIDIIGYAINIAKLRGYE